MDAGLALFGTRGYGATTIRDVCSHARLAERYFQESFGSREQLLLAVYDRAIEETVAAIAADTAAVAAAATGDPDPETVLRAGIAAAFRALTADEPRARVQLLEVVGVSATVDERWQAAMRTVATLVERLMLEYAPPLAALPATLRHDTGTMLVGGIHRRLIDWFLARDREPLDEVVDRVTAISLATLRGLAVRYAPR